MGLLNNTKDAWVGYAECLENIAVEFEKGDEEIKKVKKRFNLQAALEDLAKRQKLFSDTKNTIEGMFGSIQSNYDVMTMTLPEDKKDFVKKEVKAVQEKLEVVQRFQEKVAKIEAFVSKLTEFDGTLKSMDKKMLQQRSRLLKPQLLENSTCFHRETRFLKMPRTTKTNSRESGITFSTFRRESRQSVTTSPRTSNTGLNTKLASSLSSPGWTMPNPSPRKASLNHKHLMRPMPCMQLSMTLPRHALLTWRSLTLLRRLPTK